MLRSRETALWYVANPSPWGVNKVFAGAKEFGKCPTVERSWPQRKTLRLTPKIDRITWAVTTLGRKAREPHHHSIGILTSLRLFWMAGRPGVVTMWGMLSSTLTWKVKDPHPQAYLEDRRSAFGLGHDDCRQLGVADLGVKTDLEALEGPQIGRDYRGRGFSLLLLIIVL